MTNTTATQSLHIGHVYPVARAFGFGEPAYENVTKSDTGVEFGATSFVKNDLRVTFLATDGIVDQVSIVRGESFVISADPDAPQVGLQALAGVDVFAR